MLHQSDSIWVKSKLWMTTEHLPVDWPSLFSLLTMDSSPLDTTLTIYSYHSATNHRIHHLRLSLLAFCVQDPLNHFCWWASQTVDKWTRPCVSGVAVGITLQQGWFWAARVYCAVISSTVSQKVCWDLPIAILLSLVIFFPFVFLLHFIPPIRARGLLVQSWRELMVQTLASYKTPMDHDWVSNRDSALQSEGHIANFGIASKRPWVGWSLDWISLMLHTPRLFFLSILSEEGFMFSSLDSDFHASWLLPWHTPTWLDKGDPVAWERDLFLIFLSYKNWFFP